MFWGILVGIALTVLTVIIAVSAARKEMTPLSYIVVIVALVALCIEGVRMVDAIHTKRDVDNTVTVLQAVVLDNLSTSERNYVIETADATGIMIGIRMIYPKLARYVSADDFVGHTVAEITEVLRKAVIHNSSQRIWVNIIWMVVTMALGTVLLIATGGTGGRKVSSRHGARETERHDGYRRNPKYHSRSRR